MLLWLMANPLVHAQTQAYKQEFIIDKTLERCLDQNESTMKTIRCLDQAYINWDRELNRVYKLLLAKLQPDQKTVLVQAQLNWIKFRDSEFQLINSIYSQLQGTMYLPMSVYQKVEIVKNRSRELNQYWEILEFKE